MKIYKGGELITELATRPKNLDCGCKGGVVSIVVNNQDVTLAKYSSQERGCEVMKALSQAYLADEEEYTLPKE